MRGALLALALGALLCGVLASNDRALAEQADSGAAAKVIEKKQQSNIIPSAGAAELYLGLGDVSATGECAGDAKAACKDVTPGEGRLAQCLTKRIRQQKNGNVLGRKVSAKCVAQLTAFKMDRSKKINKDVPLARACKDDVGKFCKDQSDDEAPGSVLSCLRDNKAKLAQPCKQEVFRTQQEATEDYRLDYNLYTSCKDDVANLCSSVEQGAELDCLEEKRMQVSWECQKMMDRSERETGDDIRLSTRLFNKCLNDQQKFCADVEPGQMRVQECLEDNIDEADFSEDCKTELESMIAKRVTDFRLDTALREACETDLRESCGTTLKDMDEDEKTRRTALNCLTDYKEELKGAKCKAEVHRRLSRAARDIRFDEVLASSCMEDRNRFCSDVQPGSARVIRCLQDNRNSLDQKCAAALFDHEVKMAEDIDFKYPMKRACAWEINSFCKDIPHGHARIVRCLEDHVDNTDMSKECKDEVMKDMNRMAQDYRLNWRLNSACDNDIRKLCPNMCSTGQNVPCGGLVLQCLQDKQDNITSQACQDEVFYYELMEVSDFRNDVILAEACRNDVESYCKDVEPGEGRVHSCLRFNLNKLSENCRNEEMKLAAIEYRDIRLRPKLNKLCSEEKAVYCKDVKPGKARVIKCLMENMAQPNFGEECKEELQEREKNMKSDYRYDIAVLTNCEADVDHYCAEAKTKLRGNATVLKCLVENFKSLAEQCQAEMSRAVRLALWDYTPGAALTMTCDDDVDAICPKGAKSRAGAAFTIGAVGRCLSKSLVEGKRLEPKCRALVLVAAPKDARGYFDYPESTSALVQKIAQMQQAAGLEGTLVDAESSTVTVTGWVALACIISLIVVFIGGAVMLYKRLVGSEKPHTLHVKMGDA